MHKKITLLTGPPGAGKGTQAALIARNRDWYTFSIGQILRDSATPAQQEIMRAGKLLPAGEVVGLVVDEIAAATKPVLVDGFPRRLDQAEVFDEKLEANEAAALSVVFLHIDQEESWHRLSQRGRADDDEAVWEERWVEYREKTVPAIDYYRQSGRLLEIDGSGDIMQVKNLIEEALDASENR